MSTTRLVHCVSVIILSLCWQEVSADGAGEFWHISDLHYDPTYWTQAISCKSNRDISRRGQFGDYLCDSPFSLVHEAIEAMASLQPQPDFIIWTGDNALHFSRGTQTLEQVMELLKNVSDVISAHFPGVPVIPSLGNHDFVPKDEAGTNYSEPYGQIADMWKGWIEDDNQMELFRKGGYFSKRMSGILLVLSVNTILYYIHNNINLGLSDPAGQLAWMETELSRARAEGLKVIVTGHVMPGLRVPGLEHLFHPDFSRRYTDIMTDFSDVIVASHYGHEHAEVFKLAKREGSPPGRAVPVFSAMSIAPRARELKPGQPKYPLQPSVRLVQYDRATACHLNYWQFYTNLTESNLNNFTQWTELYNFRDTYDVPDMTTASLQDIFRRMISNHILSKSATGVHGTVDSVKNPMSSFCRHILGPTGPGHCPLLDQAEIWCGAQISDLTTAKQCVHSYLTAAQSITGS